MSHQKMSFKTEKELEEAILEEKAKGTPDIEIGEKYGVTFRYIERLITKSKGISVSSLNVYKKLKTLYPKDFKEEQTTVWSFRVLKPEKQCAILIEDTRRRRHVFPIGFKLINVFLDAGFKLRGLVIKRQYNYKTTGFWYVKRNG